MKRLTACLLAVATIRTFCSADATKLSAEDRKVLLNSSSIHEVSGVTNLPPSIVARCVDGSGRFAEPGQKWEATDFISDPKLPRARLIWAATAGEYYVVHYERGGFAHSYHILVATFKPGEKMASIVWSGGYCLKYLKDYKAFRTALESNKLDCVGDDAR